MSALGHSPPSLRRLLGALVFGVALLLAAGAGLGWRIVSQDRLAAREQERQRLEELADLVALTLRGAIAELEQAVAVLAVEGRWSAASPLAATGVTAFVGTPPAVKVRPRAGLLFLPWIEEATEEDGLPFRQAERAELVNRDYGTAIALLRAMEVSPDEAIRAGALVRLARIARKAGSSEAARESYERLARLSAVSLGGVPAPLIGLHGRCALEAAGGPEVALRRCATELEAVLLTGSWPLSPGTFGFYRAEAARWLAGSGSSSEANGDDVRRLERSLALEAAWRRTRGRDGETSGGTESIGIGNRFFLVIWRRGLTGSAGAAVAPEHFEARLEAEAAGPLRRRSASLALVEPDGSPMLVLGAPGEGPRIVRTASEMKAPWSLSLSSTGNPAVEPLLRRWFVPGGFLVAVAVILAATYASSRAVGRELAAVRLQSDFVAAVSHEFRSPLASLRQMSEMLNEGRVRDEEGRRRYLRTMERETKRLQRLVDGLLDFARLEAGVQEFRLQPLDLTHLVAEVLAEFRAEPIADGREFESELAADGLRVAADEDALSRAVWNLLENAVKYSPQGGGPIGVRVAEEEGRAAIRIADRGIGIEAGEQEAIFGRFVRGRGSRAVSAGGTGLGLAMVRRIVEAHGGDVSVNSVVGEGSVFTIQLPRVEEST